MLSSKKKLTGKHFSLIELLIVIGIMGALAALILPQFSNAESNAKDTACDYNNAGTLRYVTMFNAANGVYPSGFHAGTDAAAGTLDTATDGSVYKSMAVVTAANMNTNTTALTIASGSGYGLSLQNAGIAQLACGTKAAEDVGTVTGVRAVSADWSDSMNADGSYKSVATGGKALAIKGVDLSVWAAAGNAVVEDEADYAALSDDEKRCRKVGEPSFKIVPLFAAPTVDWEKACPYESAAQDSKVSIAMEGKCPWLDAGQFRYYMCFFKVYSDGQAAKLIATACPECGILDSENF